MTTSALSSRRRSRPLPTVERIRFISPVNAEQARRRDEAVALLMELGQRQQAHTLTATLPHVGQGD